MAGNFVPPPGGAYGLIGDSEGILRDERLDDLYSKSFKIFICHDSPIIRTAVKSYERQQ